MRGFLRHLTLFSISQDVVDFRHRVMGDAAVVAWGASFQGLGRKDLNRIQDGMGDVFTKLFSAIVREQCPLLMRGALWEGEVDEVAQEVLFLPLSSDGTRIDFVLSVGSYEKRVLGGPEGKP